MIHPTLVDRSHPLVLFPLTIDWSRWPVHGPDVVFEALFGFHVHPHVEQARQRVRELDKSQAVELWLRVAEFDAYMQRYCIGRNGAVACITVEDLEDA